MSASLDWVHLLLRVAHFTAGIAWIGSSFYFIWLDRNLTKPASARAGVDGELWMVHSGGFYQVERRRIGPGQVPAVLHWFKWEAALTWASGVLLLAVIYYLTSGVYLLDPAVSSLSAGQATLLASGTLVAGWFVYHAIWQSSLARAGWPATLLSLLLLGVVMFALFRTLSGRAAYIHVGSLLGTLMVANVWLVILPAQQAMIDATARGEQPDFTMGEQAKRRSVHNSYMTLPVLFIMLSSHFPQTYGHAMGWLVLALLTVTGAAVRHAMIGNSARSWWALAPAALSLAAAIALSLPRRGGPSGSLDAGSTVGASAKADASFAAARQVINLRCLPCHSAYSSDPVFTVAPLGVAFDTPTEIVRWAQRISERAVVQRTMPLVNQTGMADAEREVLRRWVEGGARLR